MGEIIMKRNIYFISVLAILFAGCGLDSGVSPGDNSIAGSTARFTMNGDYLYILNGNTLETYLLNDEGVLVLKDARIVTSEVETIFSRGDALFLGTTNGMYIFSLDSNKIPNLQSFYNHIVSCDPVVADSNYAFLTLNNNANNRCNRGVNQLEVIDIRDMKKPILQKVYAMNSPRGLGIDGNLLFVCDNKFKVYDRSNVDSLQLISQFNVFANDVIPYNGKLFLTSSSGFYQYSYSNNSLNLLSTILIGQ
jgi:hypothetical protein